MLRRRVHGLRYSGGLRKHQVDLCVANDRFCDMARGFAEPVGSSGGEAVSLRLALFDGPDGVDCA